VALVACSGQQDDRAGKKSATALRTGATTDVRSRLLTSNVPPLWKYEYWQS